MRISTSCRQNAALQDAQSVCPVYATPMPVTASCFAHPVSHWPAQEVLADSIVAGQLKNGNAVRVDDCDQKNFLKGLLQGQRDGGERSLGEQLDSVLAR